MAKDIEKFVENWNNLTERELYIKSYESGSLITVNAVFSIDLNNLDEVAIEVSGGIGGSAQDVIDLYEEGKLHLYKVEEIEMIKGEIK